MVIAVDIRFTEEYKNFIFETFKRITTPHLTHSFIFIFNKPFDPSFIFSENIMPVIVKQQNISLLNDLKTSSILKKYKADVFVTTQSLLRTNVPQCLIAWDKFTSKSLKKAQVIVTGSEFSKKEIIENYKIDKNKIDAVYKGVDEIFQPIIFEEKEKIKEQYADGNEYFFTCLPAGRFTGTIKRENNLLNLLKAFSVFKKMQKSNMQLLIASKTEISK